MTTNELEQSIRTLLQRPMADAELRAQLEDKIAYLSMLNPQQAAPFRS